MKPKFDNLLLEITKTTHGRISESQTFSDFLQYGALLLSIRTDPVHSEQRAKAFEQLKTNYKDDEWNALHKGMTNLCHRFEKNTKISRSEDIFKDFFFLIGASSKTHKQDFTPSGVSRLISALSIPAHPSLPEDGFFTLCDHACGSGSLLLEAVQRFSSSGHNPSAQLVIQAADIDSRCVYMTYLQLSLYGIPAVIVHGNTMSLKEYDRWYTPAYLWGRWIWRAPMQFGNDGYISDEKLKYFTEPTYAAFQYIEHLHLTTDDGMDNTGGT